MILLILKFSFNLDFLEPFKQLEEYAIVPYFLSVLVFCGYRYLWKYKSVIVLFENETEHERKSRLINNFGTILFGVILFYIVLATGTNP